MVSLWIVNVKANNINRLVLIIPKKDSDCYGLYIQNEMYLLKGVRYVPCLVIHITCLELHGGNTLFDVISAY